MNGKLQELWTTMAFRNLVVIVIASHIAGFTGGWLASKPEPKVVENTVYRHPDGYEMSIPERTEWFAKYLGNRRREELDITDAITIDDMNYGPEISAETYGLWEKRWAKNPKMRRQLQAALMDGKISESEHEVLIRKAHQERRRLAADRLIEACSIKIVDEPLVRFGVQCGGKCR